MYQLIKIKTHLLAITLLLFSLNGCDSSTSNDISNETSTSNDSSADINIGPWDITQLKSVPAYTITTDYAEEGMTGILYESIDYLGQKVEVFAYYSAPSGTMPDGGWPAAVYVHGGEGSALPTWVQYWNDRGYAAISMDHHGHYPDRTTNTPNPGPDKYGTWGDYDLPIDEQWYYHAVAQVISATSLIGSFDEVNSDKIGITGTSWGGTLTSTVIGLDNRLKWAVPVYGGGYLSDSDGSQGLALQNEAIREVVNENFDGRSYFSNVTIPTLWINGTNDSNFAMPVTKQSSQALSYSAKLRYSLRLRHNNTYVTRLEEIAAFADTVIKGTQAMPELDTPVVNVSSVAMVTFTTNVGLSSAQLLYTTDNGTWYDRYWLAIDATISGNTITASVPAGATTIYFTATDTRGLMVSSEYITLSE
ncbi:MAG: alpha/beta hydrolase family protein [Thalassotalea sp.]